MAASTLAGRRLPKDRRLCTSTQSGNVGPVVVWLNGLQHLAAVVSRHLVQVRLLGPLALLAGANLASRTAVARSAGTFQAHDVAVGGQ